jgi:two-component system sensor histidine kinase CreC
MQNAVDFSPLGARIAVTCRREENTIELCIDDEGREFQTMHSLASSKNSSRSNVRTPAEKSTGLGLNFVNEVASLHGGTAAVSNRADRGLRAVMTLPAE